jgi:hypothetical protein
MLVVATLLGATQAHAQAHFGTLCQADYQNNWRDLTFTVDRCGWFNDEPTTTPNAVPAWALIPSALHQHRTAALNDTDARLAMWDQECARPLQH